jgi:hypothetical protein
MKFKYGQSVMVIGNEFFEGKLGVVLDAFKTDNDEYKYQVKLDYSASWFIEKMLELTDPTCE